MKDTLMGYGMTPVVSSAPAFDRSPGRAGEPATRRASRGMNAFRVFLMACVLPALATAASAQTQKLPPGLAGLPDEIKTLKWQAIDMGAVKPLEHCRALLLMNHTLDELSANSAAEADLMSAYIEKNNLGTSFASTPPPPAPATLTFPDAERVAVALLRGPMSTSYYATELGDLAPGTLKSYEQMYARTCARRWSEFDESRHLVRCMSSFLGNSNKLQDYDAWATAESARREQAARQHAAAAAAAPAAKPSQDAGQQKMEAQLHQQQLELTQMKAALAAANAQQAAAPAQQTSGNPAPADNGTGAVEGANDGYGYGAYGGYGGYGYAGGAYAGAAAGAVAANDANKTEARRTAAAGQYHAANTSWNREAGYNSYAHAQTEGRMSSFHGAGGRR